MGTEIEIELGIGMVIELKVPHSVEDVKERFDGEDELCALIMTSKNLSYLKSLCDLSRLLIVEGRVEAKHAVELKRLIKHSVLLAAELVDLCRRYKHDYEPEWLP